MVSTIGCGAFALALMRGRRVGREAVMLEMGALEAARGLSVCSVVLLPLSCPPSFLFKLKLLFLS